MINVKKLRESLGLTQSEVAKAVGVSTQLISNIERGKSGIPAKRVPKYAEVLKVSAAKIFQDKVKAYQSRIMSAE